MCTAALPSSHTKHPRRDRLDTRPPADSAHPPTRREELLQTSIRLFHDRGSAGVSLDEIGKAVGMAGPSIYHHFSTKADLLIEAFTHATERLVAASADQQPPRLEQLVADYADLGVRNRLLFGVYVLEAINLPHDPGLRIKASLDDHVATWSRALALERPELDDIQGERFWFTLDAEWSMTSCVWAVCTRAP